MTCLSKKVAEKDLMSPNLPLATISWYENAKMYTDDTPLGLVKY